MAAAELTKIAAITENDKKIAAYKTLVGQLFDKKDAAGLKLVIAHVAKTSRIISTPVLDEFVTKLQSADPDLHVAAAKQALEALGKDQMQMEEHLSKILYNLAEVLIEKKEFLEAARTLQEIPLETGQKGYEKEFKVQVWVKIAQLYLQEEKSLEAERYINKAAPLTGQIKDDKLILRYKSAFVQNQDFNRKFSEAALSYYRLSQQVPEHERLDVLESGIRCSILAPAGPQRSRLLAMYYKDERASELKSYPVLEKMFLGRILKKEEIQFFSTSLLAHQRAKMADGRTLLETAVIEHNLLAASMVYNNITFDQLGALLDVSTDQAEAIASKMISEDRLQGSINQTSRLLYFRNPQSHNELNTWDQHIEHACSNVNNILELISKKHPDFIKNQK